MHRLLSPILLLTLLLGCLVTGSSASASAPDLDCGDFATQSAAQALFLSAGPGDPHGLDSEGDGRACESNPCPCSGGLPVPLVGQTTAPTPSSASDVSSGAETEGSGGSGPVRRHRGHVVKVIDGDTVKVRVNGVGVRSVRILGIDTPEVYGGRECGGDAASAHMARLAPVGARVRLESDPSQADKDRYGRWLRYVARAGVDVGRAQISSGFARTYVYRSDPFRRTRDYRRAEAIAHAKMRGSWADCW